MIGPKKHALRHEGVYSAAVNPENSREVHGGHGDGVEVYFHGETLGRIGKT